MLRVSSYLKLTVVSRQYYPAMIAESDLLCVAEMCAPLRARKYTHSPLYTEKPKALKEPRIIRAEHELRQRGAGRRVRDLGADCLERRNGKK
eukprot:1810163-Pleurochrysis_carterae.AAC.4